VMALTLDQAIAFGTLLITFALFLWGRFRYDVVAMLSLLAGVLTGLVPFDQAFSGFAHPAVITVAAVLILSRALQNAGIVDVVVRLLTPLRGSETLQVGSQAGLIAVLSGFMNNVGALGIAENRSPSRWKLRGDVPITSTPKSSAVVTCSSPSSRHLRPR